MACRPCGLGARDTLRLEAALPLYGHELDADTNAARGRPRLVRQARQGDFIGRAAIRRQQAGPRAQLVGFEMVGTRHRARRLPVPRRGAGRRPRDQRHALARRSAPIAIALRAAELAGVGSALEIEVRGRAIAAAW